MFGVGDVLNACLDNIFKILGNIKLNFTFNFLVYDNIFFHLRWMVPFDFKIIAFFQFLRVMLFPCQKNIQLF